MSGGETAIFPWYVEKWRPEMLFLLHVLSLQITPLILFELKK